MTILKTAALAAVLVGTAAFGAAVTPVAHGQSTTPRAARIAPRAIDIMGGRGSQIGVSIRDVDEEDLKTAKLNAHSGIVIEDVTTDSPAEKAGIKRGDVIVEFDGERVRSVRQFTRLVQETPGGRKVQAAVVRSGQKMTVTVEPREGDGFQFFSSRNGTGVFQDFGRTFSMPVPVPPAPPAPPATPFPPAFEYLWRTGDSLGITVGDLSPQLGEYFGTKEGALVTSVTDESPAAKMGLKAGDVITSFNGATVETPAELRRRTQRVEDGDEFTIGIVRDKKAMTLKGKAEPRRDRRRTTVRSII
jgi:serine protease Do